MTGIDPKRPLAVVGANVGCCISNHPSNDGGVLSPAWKSSISAFHGELADAMADD